MLRNSEKIKDNAAKSLELREAMERSKTEIRTIEGMGLLFGFDYIC